MLEGIPIMAEMPEKQKLSPTALTLEDAAALLTALARHPVTVDMFRADIAAGAPLRPDGKLNLVDFTAWATKEMSGDA